MSPLDRFTNIALDPNTNTIHLNGAQYLEWSLDDSKGLYIRSLDEWPIPEELEKVVIVGDSFIIPMLNEYGEVTNPRGFIVKFYSREIIPCH